MPVTIVKYIKNINKHLFFLVLNFCFIFLTKQGLIAQQKQTQTDTFFLAKKKGLLGKLGQSISHTPDADVPEKIENQYLKFKGKIIRNINIVRLGFRNNINDSSLSSNNIGNRVATAVHKFSKEKVIQRDLFFKKGDRILPYLLSDNERYYRSLPYIQDAKITVAFVPESIDSVDVTVVTKDVFSIGLNIVIDSKTTGRGQLKEENFAGSATKILVGNLFDMQRTPQQAYSAEVTKRNIGGSFIDWVNGFSNFAPSITNGQYYVTNIYSHLEKPMVTSYIASTGALEADYYKTTNGYFSDSQYKYNSRYEYYNVDGWLGYSLDKRGSSPFGNSEGRVHTFAAIRAFNQYFFKTPTITDSIFDYRFTNSTGALATMNIFRQVNYKTNYIYGFGRNEDVPHGFSVALTGGWVKKQQRKRPYAGIDFGYTNFKKQGFYKNITFRIGGFYYKNRFEDADILLNVEHFSRLKKLNKDWSHRYFITSSVTGQINTVLNSPLFLNSIYGLTYFNPTNINADFRSTLSLQSVYYNINKKILGFKFAPFAFTDLSLLKPVNMSLNKSDLFTAIGGGLRTRNENLVFGTIELRGYFFPRINADMQNWKVEISTKIQFTYNSNFIKRPDFVIDN